MAEITGDTSVQAEVHAQQVAIINQKPRPIQHQQSQSSDPSLPANTTFEEDLVTAGQRRVNLIWEYTQALIAVCVVTSNMIVGIYNGLSPLVIAHPPVLSNTLFLIVGFYFSRTNHSAIGGVGKKPQDEYSGR